MRKTIYISTLLLIVSQLSAQNDKVFSYSDTVFQEQSIRYLDLTFDYNGGFVIKDSLGLIELELLSKFISSHPEMKFDIEHHCDSRGVNEFLLKLSQFRAKRLTDELIGNYSIDSTQLRPIGYGKEKPIIKPTYENQMNLDLKDEYFRESVHFINRRTLLRIIEIKN